MRFLLVFGICQVFFRATVEPKNLVVWLDVTVVLLVATSEAERGRLISSCQKAAAEAKRISGENSVDLNFKSYPLMLLCKA